MDNDKPDGTIKIDSSPNKFDVFISIDGKWKLIGKIEQSSVLRDISKDIKGNKDGA